MRHLAIAAAVALAAPPAASAQSTVSLEFLGEALIPQDAVVDGHTFGGVSGLAYTPTPTSTTRSATISKTLGSSR